MLATLTSKGQITLPKEIRDRLGLSAGSMLDFQLQDDNTLSVKLVRPDARRIRGVLQALRPAQRTAPLTVTQMDEAIATHLRAKHLPAGRTRKSVRR